jgi:TonB family protein
MPTRLTPTSPEIEQPLEEQPRQAPSELSADESYAPGSPNGKGSAAVAAFRRSRYEELDHTDLLHVIEELEGSRNWASLREKLWIAVIIHLLIAWYLFYGPKYIYHVRVVDPSVVMKQREKELTFLDLPPDLRQKPPKPTTTLSEQDRRAQTPHPTIDRKTLEELEAMRRAGEPKPQPAPQQMQQQAPQMPALPAPPAPQVTQEQQRAAAPPAQPLPQNNQARLEMPSAPQPHYSSGPSNPNEQMQQAMRQAMRGGSQYGGDGGMNMPSQHAGAEGAVDVLSDTTGWDYGPYIGRVIYDTKRSWYPIIPESARPPLDKKGEVMIRFKILRDGTVRDMVLEGPSGDVSLDRAAWAGIIGATPYPPLPKEFAGPYLELRFKFLYNIMPGED